jgi:heme a synthase
MLNRRFTYYSLFVVAFTLLVILWGDVVQATGSGDGCGAHWPTCKGDVLPSFSGLETFIEFFHRATSGLSLLLVVGMLVWARRIFPKEHLVRLGAGFSMLFMITESLVGAALVLFRLVGEDVSIARAIIAPIHLVNTFLLIGSIGLTAWWSVYPNHRPVWRGQGTIAWMLGLGFAGIIVVAIAGAITSLGDAIFPVRTTAEAFERALTPGENFLVQLRIYHPFLAVAVSIFVVLAANWIATNRPDRLSRTLANITIGVFMAQLLVGFLNVRLEAALYTQLPHLLLSDTIWLTWLFLTVSTLSVVPANRKAVSMGGASD